MKIYELQPKQFMILFIVFMICITLIICSAIVSNSNLGFDFTMDNNTLEAVQSINYTAISQTKECEKVPMQRIIQLTDSK